MNSLSNKKDEHYQTLSVLRYLDKNKFILGNSVNIDLLENLEAQGYIELEEIMYSAPPSFILTKKGKQKLCFSYLRELDKNLGRLSVL